MLDQVLNSFGVCREQRERDGYKIEQYTGQVGDVGMALCFSLCYIISSVLLQSFSPIDSEFSSSGIADVSVILDNSIYSYEDERFMLQVIGSRVDVLYVMY